MLTNTDHADVTFVRASSLTGYPDCPRRWASSALRDELRTAGYEIRDSQRGIGAAIGTAVHAGACQTLRAKIGTGVPCPDSEATDATVQALQEQTAEGVEFDRDIKSRNDGEQVALRMLRVYRAQVAPQIQPLTVEERLEIQLTPDLVLTGQSDVIAREPGKLRDLKTGARKRNHLPQLGAYALLNRVNGLNVESGGVDFIARVAPHKPQPDADIYSIPLAQAEVAAVSILRHITRAISGFRSGADGILPGDPWHFPANPSSMLCSAKWCTAHGTEFCREHRNQEV